MSIVCLLPPSAYLPLGKRAPLFCIHGPSLATGRPLLPYPELGVQSSLFIQLCPFILPSSLRCSFCPKPAAQPSLLKSQPFLCSPPLNSVQKLRLVPFPPLHTRSHVGERGLGPWGFSPLTSRSFPCCAQTRGPHLPQAAFSKWPPPSCLSQLG